MTAPIPKAYKPWLIASLVILVISLLCLAISASVVFILHPNETTPLGLALLFGLSVFGVIAGFAGFFLLMLFAGWQAWRAARKVQVITPDHREG